MNCEQKKGFSLAEILQTIFVVGIIAGISLSFFKKQEPDIRIYKSTAKQIQYATQNVIRLACSDDLICWDSTKTITTPTCPNTGVTFTNNKCETSDSSKTDFSSNPTNSNSFVATPICSSGDLKTYREIFCSDNVPKLNTEINIGTGTSPVNCTFYYSKMYDILALAEEKSESNKKSIINRGVNASLTLANRARLYGLNSMTDTNPAILIIQYNSPHSVLYTSDKYSVSNDTAAFMFVYPNGHVVSQENYINRGGDPNLSNSLNSDLFNTTFNSEPFITRAKSTCGTDGFSCSAPVTRSTFDSKEDTTFNKTEKTDQQQSGDTVNTTQNQQNNTQTQTQ